MSCATAAETMTFHSSLESLAFAHAGHVDERILFEEVACQHVADFKSGIKEINLFEESLQRNVLLLHVSSDGLGQMLFSNITITDLERFISVVFSRLLLHNHIRSELDDSYRCDFSIFMEILSHTDFFTNQCFLHDTILSLTKIDSGH